VRLWWPIVVGALLVAFLGYRDHWFQGKPHLSAQQVAVQLGQGAGNVMTNIVCGKGAAGWDYVCIFDDARFGPMKEGVDVVRMGPYTATDAGGAVPVSACLPPNPKKHGALSDCSS
jgi:hypothetical protein